MLFKIALVAAGSALGGGLRYVVQDRTRTLVSGFPIGTLAVNVLGRTALGFLNRALANPPFPAEYRLALTVGLVGGFTTFASFGWDTLSLANGGQGPRAIMNLLLSVALGLGGVLGGYRLAARWLGA